MTARVSACIEVDLRNPEPHQAHHVREALIGIRPGDVVKLLVSEDSDKLAIPLSWIDLTDVSVQVTADSVHTRDEWIRLLSR